MAAFRYTAVRGWWFNPLLNIGSYSAISNNNVVDTLAVDEWAVTFGTAKSKLDGASGRPSPSSLYQM